MSPRKRKGGGAKAPPKKAVTKRAAGRKAGASRNGDKRLDGSRAEPLDHETPLGSNDDASISGDSSEEKGQSYFDAMAASSRAFAGARGGEEEGLAVKAENELGPPAKGTSDLRGHYVNVLFPRWEKVLQAGVNILVVGLGSKHGLLNSFVETLDGPAVIAVNGFNPQAGIKLLLQELVNLVPANRRAAVPALTSSPEELARALDENLTNDVVLLVHSMDGPSVRSAESQHVLATLVSVCSKLVLIGSVDHVNAALIWTAQQWHQFNWCVQEASTFESYTSERAMTTLTTAEALFGGANAYDVSDRRIRGAIMLLQSLSPNARAIFRILAVSGEQGMSEQQLFEVGRAEFLVTNPASLRSMLTEMETHELVAASSSDGRREKLTVSLSPQQLSHVLEATAE